MDDFTRVFQALLFVCRRTREWTIHSKNDEKDYSAIPDWLLRTFLVWSTCFLVEEDKRIMELLFISFVSRALKISILMLFCLDSSCMANGNLWAAQFLFNIIVNNLSIIFLFSRRVSIPPSLAWVCLCLVFWFLNELIEVYLLMEKLVSIELSWNWQIWFVMEIIVVFVAALSEGSWWA